MFATIEKEKPNNEEGLRLAKEIDSRALGKIGERVHPKYNEELRKCKTAKEAWITLQNIGESQECSNLIRYREEFSSMKIEEQGDVIEHISKMERIQRILKNTEAAIGDLELILRLMTSFPALWTIFCQSLRTNYEVMKAMINSKQRLESR